MLNYVAQAKAQVELELVRAVGRVLILLSRVKLSGVLKSGHVEEKEWAVGKIGGL